jgi:peptide methionine sulfoxide reductase MsrA
VFFLVHRPDLDEGIVGSLYRSEIFCTSPEQQRVAEEVNRDVDASAHWPGKTLTKIEEWAYARAYLSEAEPVAEYDTVIHTYNHHRGHTALAGQSPADRVPNLCGQYI